MPPTLPHLQPGWLLHRGDNIAQCRDSTLIVTVSVLGIRPVGSAVPKGTLAATALTLAYWRLPLGCGRILPPRESPNRYFEGFFFHKCLQPGSELNWVILQVRGNRYSNDYFQIGSFPWKTCLKPMEG